MLIIRMIIIALAMLIAIPIVLGTAISKLNNRAFDLSPVGNAFLLGYVAQMGMFFPIAFLGVRLDWNITRISKYYLLATAIVCIICVVFICIDSKKNGFGLQEFCNKRFVKRDIIILLILFCAFLFARVFVRTATEDTTLALANSLYINNAIEDVSLFTKEALDYRIVDSLSPISVYYASFGVLIGNISTEFVKYIFSFWVIVLSVISYNSVLWLFFEKSVSKRLVANAVLCGIYFLQLFNYKVNCFSLLAGTWYGSVIFTGVLLPFWIFEMIKSINEFGELSEQTARWWIGRIVTFGVLISAGQLVFRYSFIFAGIILITGFILAFIARKKMKIKELGGA